MKVKILEFKNGNIAIVSDRKHSNKKANIKTSSIITIDKEDPIRVIKEDVPKEVFSGSIEVKKVRGKLKFIKKT